MHGRNTDRPESASRAPRHHAHWVVAAVAIFAVLALAAGCGWTGGGGGSTAVTTSPPPAPPAPLPPPPPGPTPGLGKIVGDRTDAGPASEPGRPNFKGCHGMST